MTIRCNAQGKRQALIS